MNIGINTLQYARNYGAMLQAYALKTFLESQGHSVCFINKRLLPICKWNPKPFKKCTLLEKLLYIKYLVKWYLPPYILSRIREHNFDRFYNHFLNTMTLSNLDVVIYGSDQIWSKFKFGFNPYFWGYDGLDVTKRIAFSASMGVLDIKEEDRNFITSALKQFSFISVREQDLCDMLNGGHYAEHTIVYRTIDPVFLLNKQIWEALASKRIVNKPYLLFYDFQIDAKTTTLAKQIAKERGLLLVRITDGIVDTKRDKYHFKCAGPLQFLSLIKYADFVLASSFHGTAFSIIFHKEFCVRQIWNTSRVMSLLNLVGLSDRMIDKIEDFRLCVDVDYHDVDLRLEKEKLNSKLYLQGALKE